LEKNDWNYGDGKKPSFSQYIKNSCDPSINIIAQNELPEIKDAGNVLR